jgi:hypothetical protein
MSYDGAVNSHADEGAPSELPCAKSVQAMSASAINVNIFESNHGKKIQFQIEKGPTLC